MRQKLPAVLMGTLLLTLSVCGCGGGERSSESGGKDGSGNTRGSDPAQNRWEELLVPLTPATLFDVTDTEGVTEIGYKVSHTNMKNWMRCTARSKGND